MTSIINRPGYLDRFSRDLKRFALAYPDKANFLQSSELNEMQSMADDKLRRVAEYILQDGRVIRGEDPLIKPVTGDPTSVEVTLPACAVYIGGFVHDVPAAVFTLSAAGAVKIGVRVSSDLVTDVDDASLKGPIEGTEGYSEPGAARVSMSAAWGYATDGKAGDFVSVYSMQDGTIITNETNIDFSEIYNAIGAYSRESNGSYVSSGCEVTALGLNGSGEQRFVISEGVAYVNGRRLPRQQSFRLKQPETPELRSVSAEPHGFTAATGGTQTFQLSKSPIAAVTEATIIKEATENVVHGAYTGASDPLAHPSVESIISVDQGGTNYTSPADWLLSAGEIDWSPGGAEPAPGSTYTVQYRYYENVAPDSVTRDSVTVSGAVTGTNVLVDYDYKLPRVDAIVMLPDGSLNYMEGVSATVRPRAPIVPKGHLELARVVNKWGIAPDVIETATRNVPYSEITSMKNMLIDLYDLVAQERLKSDITARETASKRGVFVDPFVDDDMRDSGIAQTAASFGGRLRLPITASVHEFPAFLTTQTLDYTEEAIISQLRETGEMKINPYATFTPMPGRCSLEPSSDIWTETQTEWTSPETQKFEAGDGEYIAGIELSSRVEKVRETTRKAAEIRVRDVNFRLEGFIEGETIGAATFDGEDIAVTGAAADVNGVISGSFTIPAGIPTGAKVVAFEGSAGTKASATYVARGTVTVEEYRLTNSLETTTGDLPEPVIIRRVVNEGRGAIDPLAQTFTLTEERCVSSIRLKCKTKGASSNSVLVQIRETQVGLPVRESIAEAFVPGGDLTEGEWFDAVFRLPVFLEAGREYAFVALTDDADHSLAVAEVGKLDAAGDIVTEQPFTVGVLLSSSNASTWNVHNDRDLVFELMGCVFAPEQKTVPIGAFTAANMSDIVVSAPVEFPTQDSDVEILLTRPNGEVIRSSPDQRIQLSEFISNETIQVSAVLSGTDHVTPFLFPAVQVIEGELKASAGYVSRAVPADNAARASVTFDANLPAGSTVTVKIGEPGNYAAENVSNATQLGEGWVEQTYERTPYAPLDARAYITITGTPAARPMLRDLRLVTTEV